MSEELKPLDVTALVPKLNPTLVVDGAGLEQLRKFLASLAASSDTAIGYDVETNICSDFWFRRVRTVQIGNKNNQFVVDMLAFADGNEDKLFNSQGEHGKHSQIFKPVMDVLNPALESNAFIKVGVNLPFDYECGKWSFGTRMWSLYSCDLAERCIVAGLVSLKLYSYFSLASLVARYFGWEIDKESQTSFDLKTPLTEKQIIYCALDTRLPLAIRAKQLRILKADGLEAVVQIENDAIGAFVDMHLHGQRLDKDKWMARYHSNQAKLVATLKTLDTHFLPIVGSKVGAIDHAQLSALEATWRAAGNIASAEEIAKTQAFKAAKDPQEKLRLRAERDALTAQRKEQRAAASATYIAYRKRCNASRDLLEKCEGDALINYNSPTQMLKALKEMRIGLSHLETCDVKILKKYIDKPVVKALVERSYLQKQIGTYGAQWVNKWTTKPCKDEGFLHPMDGRLHSKFNQLEAVNGRSSSDTPNSQNLPRDPEVRACFIADSPDEAEPLGYDLLTIDMSGAELRILTEVAQTDVWINAFNKKQDLHSVSTDLMYPQEWLSLALPTCAYYERHNCDETIVVKGKEYFNRVGEAKKQQCSCPGHKGKRNISKAVTFKLVNGGMLVDGYNKEQSKEIMARHKVANPEVWAYLEQSGKNANITHESRSMYGRRVLFPPPTWEGAQALWRADEGTEEKHNPTTEQTRATLRSMYSSIERRGKNIPLSATNADIAKRAIGCGFSAEGIAYLWHKLQEFPNTKLLAFIHDEFIFQVPKRIGAVLAKAVGDGFRTAGDEVMHFVEMESDFHLASHWQK